MTDLLGHIGYLWLTLGQVSIAGDPGGSLGWCARAVGEMIWIGIGLKVRMTSIWIWGLIGLATETYGLWGTLS